MDLVSIVPLASNYFLHKSLISPIHELKPFRRTIPTLGMSSRGKSHVIPFMSMQSFTTGVSDDGHVQRRTGCFHPNIWNEADIIQRLSTPYRDPSYRECAEKLIDEVKKMFNSISLEDAEFSHPLNDCIQRLSMVDSVERLGIDRNFKNEIKSALDFSY